MNKPLPTTAPRTLSDMIEKRIKRGDFTRDEFEEDVEQARREMEAETAAYEAAQQQQQPSQAA